MKTPHGRNVVSVSLMELEAIINLILDHRHWQSDKKKNCLECARTEQLTESLFNGRCTGTVGCQKSA